MNKEENKRKIKLPLKKGKKGTSDTEPDIEFKHLVIVGANGSGKTRFGAYVEAHYNEETHRISAQKSLSMPECASIKSKEVALSEFIYGLYYKGYNDKSGLKMRQRWGDNPNTFLLDDYSKLMTLLHTEEYELLLNYKEGRIPKPVTKIDTIQKIWEYMLPHRKLMKGVGIIEAYPAGQEASKYNASEMSDGERVIFYLIGQVLCAPQNAILIIDEPEMHIHKSLVKKLFDKIENERQDCSYIYLTHDIDFAFSRHNAKRIWVKDYFGSNIWDYEILETEAPIPEQLYLEVLGSRNPVIFLEGNNSSMDYQLYEQVYNDYTLKPLGSCEQVIQSVKSFNNENWFHNIKSFGIIDRDRRAESEITKLNDKNIWVLDVAEVENILLIEGVVKTMAEHMGKNADDVFSKVKQNIIKFFITQLDDQVLLHYKEIIEREMVFASISNKKKIKDVITEIESNFRDIKQQNIFDEIKKEFGKIIDNSDHDGILRVFNLKGALIPKSGVCKLISVNNKNDYFDLVLTLLKNKNTVSETISNSIKSKTKGSHK